jgi:hypothetical protein
MLVASVVTSMALLQQDGPQQLSPGASAVVCVVARAIAA